MTETSIDLQEFHWMMGLLQTIDVGLLVLDKNYQICLWNSFMENHSGHQARAVQGQSIFTLFPEIQEHWFRQKSRSVFFLSTQVYTNWEQRPFLFRFANYRPITGRSDFMYQNVSIIPLTSVHGEVNHIGIMVYDVTDVAVNRKALMTANQELERLSRTDRLTQLYNRGFWEECLVRELKRWQRSPNMQAALVMFDIDHFKRVNDTYGHQAGDEVIRVTASALRQQLRETDIGGRYGGEEFGAILVGADAEGSVVFAERLRADIERRLVMHEGMEIRYTISLGVAPLSTEVADVKAWIERADRSLYHSKETGRNRVTLFSDNMAGHAG